MIISKNLGGTQPLKFLTAKLPPESHDSWMNIFGMINFKGAMFNLLAGSQSNPNNLDLLKVVEPILPIGGLKVMYYW